MDKLFGESFDEYVHNQVNIRQNSLKKHQKDVDDLQVFNTSTPWVRLTSSITIDAQRTKELATNLDIDSKKIEGSNLAKNLVLFAGVSKGDNLKNRIGGVGYGLDNTYGFLSDKEQGYKPMPGITNISTTYKNNGSLKQAQVNITCFTRKQFEALEALYLRLGYTVILEWGHSVYFDNNGEKQNMSVMNIPNLMFKKPKKLNPQKEAKKAVAEALRKNPNLEWYEQDEIYFDKELEIRKENESSKPTPTQIRKGILKSKEITGGNYDGMLAKVSNFSWNLNNDLSYSITLDLISVGDVIDSLKMNVGGTKLTKNETPTVQVASGVQNIATIKLNASTSTFHSFLYELTTTLTSEKFVQGQVNATTQAQLQLADQAVKDVERLTKVKERFRSTITTYKDVYVDRIFEIQQLLLATPNVTVTSNRKTSAGDALTDKINWSGNVEDLKKLFTPLPDPNLNPFFQNGIFTDIAFDKTFFAFFGIGLSSNNTQLVKKSNIVSLKFEEQRNRVNKVLNYIENLNPDYKTEEDSNQGIVNYLIQQTDVGGKATAETLLRILEKEKFDKEEKLDASFIFN